MGGLAYSAFGVGGQDPNAILVSYAALVVGYLLISVGKGSWLRFSVRPRADEVLAINLKTFDTRAILFNYVSNLPVDHLLLTPNGCVVVETRPYIGDIVVTGDRWSRKRGLFGWLQFISEGALGNPTKDALRGVESVRAMLAQRLGAEIAAQIPVEPAVVFTHSRVSLSIENPTIRVCHARDCRGELKALLGSNKAPGDAMRRLEVQLIQEAAIEGEPVSAGEAIDRPAAKRKRPRAAAKLKSGK